MGGGTGQGLSGFHFGAVDNVVTGEHADAERRQVGRVGIHTEDMGSAGAVPCGIGEGSDQVMATVAECLQIGSGQAGAPRSIRLHYGGVSLAVQGQGDGAARIGNGRGAGHGLRHLHLGSVEDIVARDGIDGEGWRGLIDGDGGVQRIAVARRIGDRHGQGWRAIWQRLQIGGRKGDAPMAAAIHGAGVGFAAQSHGDRLPRAGDAGGAGKRLWLTRLCAIQDAITKRRVQCHRRQIMSVNVQIVRGGYGRTIVACHAGRNGVVAFGQQLQIGARHLQCPTAFGQYQSGIGFAIERDGNGSPGGDVGRGAADGKRKPGFDGVELIVGRDNADIDGRELVIYGDKLRRGGCRIASLIAKRGDHLIAAVGQGGHICGRHADAPFAICAYDPGIGFAIE
ncbi:Uncharacterised protein [Serratia fonticola]|nr:Uncharacterised protein [Serratia fonticola]